MKLTDYLEGILAHPLVRDAREFAREKHGDQTRRDGTPYFNHPDRVAKFASKYKVSKELPSIVAAAYLHDTKEDCDISIEEIRAKFGDLTAELVSELTSDKDKLKAMGKTDYLTDKMLNMSSYALIVKLVDRLDNVSDLLTAKEEFRNRYKLETETIINSLLKNRELSGTHKRIIHDIQLKLFKLNEV